MSGVWNTNVSVRIDEECPVRFRVHNKDVVEFWARGDRNEFDMSFEVKALRRFLELGARAVADADALRTPNDATNDRMKIVGARAGGDRTWTPRPDDT